MFTAIASPVSLTGVLALLITVVLALGMARDGRTRAFYALLCVVHLLGALAFYFITFSAPADAHRYYAESEWARDFAIGTRFINFLLGWIREFTDLTFLDASLVFQIPGLVGILLIHRSAVRLAEDGFGTRVMLLGLLLLLPGLHFWTSSVGKDSLAIFAYGLIAVALSRERIHIALMIAGLILYFLIRPHIGFMLVTAMAIAFLPLFGRSPPRTQVVGAVAAAAFFILLPFVFLFIGIDGEGVEGVQKYIENRQNLAFRGGSDFDLTALNPLERLVTVLFRPLFLDARGTFGLAISFENLALVAIFAYLAWNLRVILRLVRVSAAMRFHVFFALIFIAAVSQTTGNLGLALRYKMMMVPALILLLTAVIAYHNRRREDRRAALRAEVLPAA